MRPWHFCCSCSIWLTVTLLSHSACLVNGKKKLTSIVLPEKSSCVYSAESTSQNRTELFRRTIGSHFLNCESMQVKWLLSFSYNRNISITIFHQKVGFLTQNIVKEDVAQEEFTRATVASKFVCKLYYQLYNWVYLQTTKLFACFFEFYVGL